MAALDGERGCQSYVQVKEARSERIYVRARHLITFPKFGRGRVPNIPGQTVLDCPMSGTNGISDNYRRSKTRRSFLIQNYNETSNHSPALNSRSSKSIHQDETSISKTHSPSTMTSHRRCRRSKSALWHQRSRAAKSGRRHRIEWRRNGGIRLRFIFLPPVSFFPLPVNCSDAITFAVGMHRAHHEGPKTYDA